MQEQAAREQRRRLALLRSQRATASDGLSHPSTVPVLGMQPLGSGSAPRAAMVVSDLDQHLQDRLSQRAMTGSSGRIGSERPRETLAHPVTSDTGRDPLHLLQARAKQRARPDDFQHGKHDASGGGIAAPAGGAPTASRPEELSKAVLTMTTAVAKLAQSLSDSKEASVLKWERKRPTIRMTNPEEFMSELIGLENAFAETGAKSFSRRWAIFC